MKYPALHKAKRELFEKQQLIEDALAELKEVEQFMKKHDRQLQRKEVAKIIGCTPEHVSHLKKTGQLDSYRYSDVHDYLQRKRG